MDNYHPTLPLLPDEHRAYLSQRGYAFSWTPSIVGGRGDWKIVKADVVACTGKTRTKVEALREAVRWVRRQERGQNG